MHKSVISLCAALLCALSLSSSVQAEDQTLRIGTEPSFAPFEFTDEKTGELAGFDIDVMEAIGAAAGYKIEWMQMPFDGLIPSILSNSLDAAISGFTMNEERKKRVAFSEPYYIAGQSIMTRKDLADEITDFKSLEGRAICVQIGSVGAKIAEETKDAKVITFNTTSEAYLELDRGGCEAMITGTPVHQYYLALTGNPKFVLLPEIMNAAGLGIIMNKNNDEMQKIINDGFAKIKEDGTYQKVYDKWFKPKEQ